MNKATYKEIEGIESKLFHLQESLEAILDDERKTDDLSGYAKLEEAIYMLEESRGLLLDYDPGYDD